MFNANRCMLVFSFILIGCCIGCDQQKVAETVKAAEKNVEKSANNVASEASQMAQKGREMAEKLGAEATALLNPLKEKFGNLEKLKESPQELKTAVADIVTSMEENAGKLKLPESVNESFAKLKAELISLKEYLDGEYEQAKIAERLKGIMESFKSVFGA